MLVSEILERLSLGPLSNLSLANDGDGSIRADKIPTIISYTNEALVRLYTRFTLSEKELILETNGVRTKYKIDSKYAQSRSADFPDNDHYIIDQNQPFTDDFIRVLAVHGTGGGAYKLNDDGAMRSLFTPQVNVLQVPSVWNGVPLFVMYQAKHPKLDVAVEDFTELEVDIPTVLEEALLSYIAHKVFAAMSGPEHIAVASAHLSTYENVCKDVEDKDLVNSSLSQSNTKFELRGFV